MSTVLGKQRETFWFGVRFRGSRAELCGQPFPIKTRGHTPATLTGMITLDLSNLYHRDLSAYRRSPQSSFHSRRMPHSERLDCCIRQILGVQQRHSTLGLVKVNALAAGAISHSLMEISAVLADPDRWNSAGKAMLAITNVRAFFGLFP